MSRDDGFAVMDVSVDIVNDPKIRKLYRVAPEHASAGVVAYVATMGESWKAGERVTVEDAWPAFLPFAIPAVEAMKQVGLLDAKGFVSTKAWRGWFDPAKTRRDAVRDRWRRANEKRLHSSTNDSADTARHNDDTASLPRGSRDDTGANHSVPFRTDTVPLDSREIPPPPAERGRRKAKTNPRSNGTAPRQKRANPRANGTSIRQERADQKRGPTALADVLRRASHTEAGDVDDDALANL